MNAQLEFILDNCNQMTVEELNQTCSQIEMDLNEEEEYLFISKLDCSYTGNC